MPLQGGESEQAFELLEKKVQLYALNLDILKKDVSIINKHAANVIQIENGQAEITIDSDGDENLLISIPKDDGWDIEVNGIRTKGSMLGMGIGDAMGARYEFKKVRYGEIDLKDMGKPGISNFNMQPGQWTDDTSMGLCLADSLLMNKGELNQHDLMRRFLCWWYGGYNNAFRNNPSPRHSVGLGGNISQSFSRYSKYQEAETGAGNINTSGNGSIMRNAAIPICFHYDINKARENL